MAFTSLYWSQILLDDCIVCGFPESHSGGVGFTRVVGAMGPLSLPYSCCLEYRHNKWNSNLVLLSSLFCPLNKPLEHHSLFTERKSLYLTFDEQFSWNGFVVLPLDQPWPSKHEKSWPLQSIFHFPSSVLSTFHTSSHITFTSLGGKSY